MRTRKDERGFLQWPPLKDKGTSTIEIHQHHEAGQIWLMASGNSGRPFEDEVEQHVGVRLDRRKTERLIAILIDTLNRSQS